MQKDDTSFVTLEDVRTAIALLTRIPIKATFDRSAEAAWAYPVVGIVIAAIASIVTASLLWLGLGPLLAAGVWITTTSFLTGAMHEDGLADCADGFWGGFDTTRRLDIMKDSQIGTYGVLALIIVLGIRWVAIAGILGAGSWFWPLLALEVTSRAAIPAIMHSLPNARFSGLSHSQGRPPMNAALLAIAIAAGIALICVGWAALKLVILVGLTSWGVSLLAQSKIGGQTGDVLGASQQVAIAVGLMALS